MEKSLSLYKLVNGQAVPFPSAADQITVSAFTATYQRMGAAPSITATVMHSSCLDGQWKDVFVEFRDERFFVKNEPSSEKDNTDERYSHSATFVSERQQLDEVYMIDAVQSDSSVDGYKSNDTKILFMGDIAQWAARLNDALAYSGLYDPDTETGYHVVIDSGITSEDVLVSFEDKFISEALQEGFKAFDIPYYFVGKTIHFGYVESTISSPVEYGSDKELLRVGRENANIKLTNRCSGYGSSENIPYYYPNKTPLGDVSLNVSSSATVSIRSMERLGTRIGNFPLSYGWRAFEVGDQVAEGLVSQYSGRSGSRYVYTGGSAQVVFEDTFVMNQSGLVSIQISAGNDWSLWEKRGVDYNDGNYGPHLSGVTDVKAVNVSTGVEYSVGSGVTLPAGEYKVKATVVMELTNELQKESPVSFSVTMHYACTTGSWLNNVGNAVDAFDLGLTVSGTPAIGDTVALNVIHRMEAITRLMPPIFRSTDGAERFYNALNDTYPHPDGGYYEFENEYSDSDRRELIQEFPDIKPTITGIKNAANQRIDQFVALAWDTNDNDEVDENGNYIHPYFFAKLAKTNGTYGFNLFDCASDSAMVVSFTSGVCGACKFEIAVDQDTKKNTVQVDGSGNLLRDAYGDVRCGREGKPAEQFLESQQDTSAGEVWIALKKDNSTYPVIMPSVVRNLKPTTSDTFVLLNIILPYGYITAAEDRLKDAIIEYMASVNSPMFNPSVGFSRVFLEENPTFLSSFNENALLPVKYNNRTESFYVSTFTYTMSSGEILPEISVDLISKITATSNSLQTKLDAVKDDILKAVNTRDFMQQALLYFLRKDIEDTASERITFLKGAYFGRFSSGDLGSGGAVQIDTDGNSLAEVDYLKVRKKATFAELVVDKEKAVEGDVVITPAATVIVRVETHTGYYRCFFQKTDNDGNIVYNPFVIGDLARCQTFNLTDNKYYWRKVVGVGQDYIDLSTAQGEYDGSDIPEAGDNVVQLGNVSDADRQSAITLSSYGTNSPSMKMYHGINSFSLSGKDMYGVEYDPSTGYPRFYNYGAMRLGAREGEDGSFISYDNVSKQMNIKAIVNFLPQSTGLEQLDAYQKLVQIAQGNIETWFHDGVSPAQTGAPTMSNYPVNTWEDEDYESHVGDIYYSDSGKGYRFKKTGSTYSWEIISDSELAALSQQIQGLQYLKAATNEGTLISGGLVLTSMIQLGYTDSSDVYHVMSGISGQGSDAHAIAAWYGGSMLDRYEYVNGQYVLKDPIPQGAATSLVRFDGTGYFAKGNIFWDENGYGQVGGSGNNYAVKWDANGVTLGNGIKLGSSDETLSSLLEVVNKLDGLFTKESYTEGGVTKYRIKANYGLYSDSFISAGGLSQGGTISGLAAVYLNGTQIDDGSRADINILVNGTPASIRQSAQYGKHINIETGTGGSSVSWGTAGADTQVLTVDGVSKTLLTGHQSLSAYRTAANQDTIDNAIKARLGDTTSSNPAADKDFVNSSIATSTATFRGTSASGLTEAQFLSWANGLTKDDNDYVFWNTVDSAGNTQYKRYKYNGSSWVFEYTLNNSSFTAAQWAAIGSGITSSLVTKLNGIASGAQVNVLEKVKLNGSELTITSKAVNVNAATSLTMPTGLSAAALTSAGNIAVSFQNGYSIPTTSKQTSWDTGLNTLASLKAWIESLIGVDDNGDVYIKPNGTTPRNFYSYGNVSAGGLGTGGGGGGSIVTWNQLATGGTKIATISIDGVSTDVYAPATQSLEGLGASLGAASDALTLKNQSGTVLSTITAANLVTVLGNTAVNRAREDVNGNNIVNTYLPKKRGTIFENDPLTGLAGASGNAWSFAEANDVSGQYRRGGFGYIWIKALDDVTTEATLAAYISIGTDAPWTSGAGLYITSSDITWKNKKLLDAGNYIDYAANKLSLAGTEYVQSGGKITISGANLATAIGTNPVARATGDSDGNNIADTYETKTQVNNKVITAVSLTTTKLTLTRSAGNLEANVPTWNQDTTGNAATATALKTARNIWGQSFNGTAAISGDMSSVGKVTFAAKTSKATSGNVLEVVTINGVNYLHTTLPFFSDESVSAGGIGTGGGGGTDVSWTNGDANYGVLTIAGNAHNVSILGHTHSQYMLANLKGAANGVAELGSDSKIPMSQLPDIVMGQLLYGGTVNASNVATLSANVKAKLGISSSTVTLTNGTGTYGYTKFEGVYFIMSADSSFASLDLKVGDWLISTGTAWKKIDNTDAVTGVKGQNQTSYQVGNVNISWDNVKPSAGVAKAELASDVKTSLGKADTAYQKASTGIPKTDLASAVQTSLGKADSALQAHQTIYAATFSAGTFSAKTYNPKSAAQTINIPTTTSHISEGSNLYFTNARAISACSGTYAKLTEANTFTASNTFSDAVTVKSLTITQDSTNQTFLAFTREGYNYITVPSSRYLAIGYASTGAETIVAISGAAIAPYSSGSYKDTTTLGTAATPWQAVYGKTYYADCTSGATVMNAKLQNGTTYSIMGASSSTPSGWTGWTTPGVLLGTNTANTSLTLRSGGTIHTYVGSSTVLSLKRSDSTTAGCYIRFANNATTNPYIGYFGVYKSGTTIQYRWYKYSTPSSGDQEVTKIAHLDTDGNFVANGQVTAGAASDLRFKKNIESMSRVNAESILAGLRPVEFDWNELGTELSGNKGHDTGLIAQEVLGVFPYAVSPIYERYLRVDYAKLTPILVAGWQSHETRIEKLERENMELREEIKRLRS